MFKNENSAVELFEAMARQLEVNASEGDYTFEKFAKAVDCLNVAAEACDDIGLGVEAEEITSLLEKLAKKAPKKPVKKPIKKDEKSESKKSSDKDSKKSK